MDVLVDQIDGLCAKRMPHQRAGPGCGLNRNVDLRQPAVIRLIGHKDRVRRQRLPQLAQVTVVLSKGITHLIVGQTLLRRDQPLVPGERAVDAGEVGETGLHGARKLGAEVGDVGDHLAETFLVELQSRSDVVENAQIVHDEAVRLPVAVGAVGARHCLQQRMVAQRLV